MRFNLILKKTKETVFTTNVHNKKLAKEYFVKLKMLTESQFDEIYDVIESKIGIKNWE